MWTILGKLPDQTPKSYNLLALIHCRDLNRLFGKVTSDLYSFCQEVHEEATENTKCMSLDTKMIFILFIVQDVVGQKESDLNSDWGLIISAPIWIPFGMTPGRETEGAGLYLTVKSLEVRI